MNEEIVKNYEADYQFFLSEAARCCIEKDKSEIVVERTMMIGQIVAFKSAAYIMYFRLGMLSTGTYSNISSINRQCLIDREVTKIVKERS